MATETRAAAGPPHQETPETAEAGEVWEMAYLHRNHFGRKKVTPFKNALLDVLGQ